MFLKNRFKKKFSCYSNTTTTAFSCPLELTYIKIKLPLQTYKCVPTLLYLALPSICHVLQSEALI